LEQLLDRMRNTVQEAEETEPLLAKNLYDAARKATEQSVPEALRDASQLANLGVADEAVKASRRAGQGIDQLREGVERAARSVLGDEPAALRRAQGELDDLADQVNREIARATGREPSARPGNNAQNNPNRQRRPGQGQQQGQDQQQGQPQDPFDAAEMLGQ